MRAAHRGPDGRYICIMAQIRKSAPAASTARTRRARPMRTRPMTARQAFACASPVDDLLDPALFKALGDPTRVKLLSCIIKCGRPCSVGEIAACCSVDLSVVSRHLAALARAGLAEASKSGRVVRYAARHAQLCQTLRALAAAVEECVPAGRASCEGGRCGC